MGNNKGERDENDGYDKRDKFLRSYIEMRKVVFLFDRSFRL